jgi:hypothetical protein
MFEMEMKYIVVITCTSGWRHVYKDIPKGELIEMLRHAANYPDIHSLSMIDGKLLKLEVSWWHRLCSKLFNFFEWIDGCLGGKGVGPD